ncbi:copper amine oxidase-like protein [Fusarium sp. MPI-SDFR-AT-0072]|nr:copper amine oxidase-like protein [Fusarium sp. MPI-SDFR-AT-0072]
MLYNQMSSRTLPSNFPSFPPTESATLSASAAKMLPAKLHPFSQLTAAEIKRTSQIVQALHHANASLVYACITLDEPEKNLALAYLQAEHDNRTVRPTVDRRASATYYVKGNPRLHEAVVNLTKDQVVSNQMLGESLHGAAISDEVAEVVELVHKDPLFLQELEKHGLDESLVVCEPWMYGSDGIDDARRLWQCFMFLRHPDHRDDMDCNHYAMPLPFSPVVDAEEGRIIRIDQLPTGADNLPSNKKYEIPPPNEYLSNYQQLRADLKPLNVIQPEGASFTIAEDFESSHLVQWQKWRFRVGFNGREGMVLYDVRYDGRPLFYRMSLSDMNIPYGDPRAPYHRKAAFDLGDAGAGYTANNLSLGFDCLGSIFYISSRLSGYKGGDIVEKPNCICIHEQDSGIGWKHTNFRTNNASVTRARELVLQSIMTVANYEYIAAFIFTQAGDVTYEVRATGILSTQPVDRNTEVSWGTVVHPGVLAAHHQHIFSLRLDPMVDGANNRLVYEEAHAMDRSHPLNVHGTGYYSDETVVQRSGGYDLDEQKNRVFKIKNNSSRNPVNGMASGYKIMVPDFQKILASRDSFHYRRSEFADHNIYVTKYRPNQLYAAGQYTNQSRGGDGVRSWASQRDSVVDEDIVVWVQFGINHIPRIEDFPVMPVEILRVQLRPVNFFTKNPALDVPPSTQAFNKSCQLREAPKQRNATQTQGGISAVSHI